MGTRATQRTVLFVLLVLVWVATPLMGDRVPLWAQLSYWGGLLAASALALLVALRDKKPLLGAFGVLTAFAWPITLFVALALGGV